MGTVSNFCMPHASLSQTRKTTPAMAAGITDHCWTLHELLSFQCAAGALGTTEAAWTSCTGTATLDRALAFVTTVNCGATRDTPRAYETRGNGLAYTMT